MKLLKIRFAFLILLSIVLLFAGCNLNKEADGCEDGGMPHRIYHHYNGRDIDEFISQWSENHKTDKSASLMHPIPKNEDLVLIDAYITSNSYMYSYAYAEDYNNDPNTLKKIHVTIPYDADHIISERRDMVGKEYEVNGNTYRFKHNNIPITISLANLDDAAAEYDIEKIKAIFEFETVS